MERPCHQNVNKLYISIQLFNFIQLPSRVIIEFSIMRPAEPEIMMSRLWMHLKL